MGAIDLGSHQPEDVRMKGHETMATYCVNKDAQSGSNDHEVHDTTTSRWCHPEPANQLGLGTHPDCASAVRAAKAYFSDVNGCRWCAPGCHTG